MSSVNENSKFAILQKFPKIRPPLPDVYQKLYEREYLLNREGGGVVEKIGKWLEAWMHKRIARDNVFPVLEVGGGTLNHISYEDESILEHYDVVEPFESLYASSPLKDQVRRIYPWMKDVPSSQKYKRIISIAVLEHMEELPKEVARCAMHLDEGGVFRVGIPSEGGLLWYLAWRFGTGLAFWLRNRLDYGVLMRHEHVNNATEIVEVINLLFRQVEVKRWPISWIHGSFYTYIEASQPNMQLCQNLLSASPADSGEGICDT